MPAKKPTRITPLDRSVRTAQLKGVAINNKDFVTGVNEIILCKRTGDQNKYFSLTNREARELVKWLTTPQEVG